MTQKIGVILPLSFGQQPAPPPIWAECRSPVALLRPSVGWCLAARLRNRLGYYYLSLQNPYVSYFYYLLYKLTHYVQYSCLLLLLHFLFVLCLKVVIGYMPKTLSLFVTQRIGLLFIPLMSIS